MRSPSIKAILVCGRILCDAGTRNHTLVDVLLGLRTPSMPVATSLCLYMCMTEVLETATLELKLARVESEKEVLLGEVQVGRSHPDADPNQVLGIASPQMLMHFQQEGLHELRVYHGRSLLATQPFPVRLAENAPQPPTPGQAAPPGDEAP